MWEIGHLRGDYHLKFDIIKAAGVDPTPFFMVPRVVSAVAGVVTIALVNRLTAALFDRLTGIVAALLLAVAFLHVRDSHFGVTDVPMTCLVVAAAIPLTRLLADPTRRRDWIVAGALAGLAASTKYTGGLVVTGGLAVAIVAMAERRGPESRAVLTGVAWFAIASLIAFVLTTPFAVIDVRQFVDALQFIDTTSTRDTASTSAADGCITCGSHCGTDWAHRCSSQGWLGLPSSPRDRGERRSCSWCSRWCSMPWWGAD